MHWSQFNTWTRDKKRALYRWWKCYNARQRCFQQQSSIEFKTAMHPVRLTRLKCPSCHVKFLRPEDLEDDDGYTCEPCKDCRFAPHKRLREKTLRTRCYICWIHVVIKHALDISNYTNTMHFAGAIPLAEIDCLIPSHWIFWVSHMRLKSSEAKGGYGMFSWHKDMRELAYSCRKTWVEWKNYARGM